MYPHEVWVVCRGVVQLNTLHPSGDEVLVGFAVQAMPFGFPLTSLEPYQAIALSDVDLMRFTIIELEPRDFAASKSPSSANRSFTSTSE